MGHVAVSWNSTSHSLLRNTVLLSAAQLLLFCLVLPIALWQQGTSGLYQSAAALLLCWIPSVAALALSHRFMGTPQVLAAVLGGMALRAVPPLLVCLFLALKSTGHQWLHFICYLLVFYTFALGIETYLSVGLLKTKQPGDQVS